VTSTTVTNTTASSVRKVLAFPYTRIAVVGSRDFQTEALVKQVLLVVLKDYHVVVSGGARGVDSWAIETARAIGAQVCEHKPDWDTHGKAAGFLRNTIIVRDSEVVLAFWNQKSKGTLDTLTKASQLGKLIIVVTEDLDVFSNHHKVAA
jgi:predicted Rossmann fold nucleotide-binding protein DprA/Smf involved in DNA uptake